MHSTVVWGPTMVWGLDHDITKSCAWPYPHFTRIHLHSGHVQQCKVAPILPSMAYQGAETHSIYDIVVECTPWWFGAWTMTLLHHMCLAIPPLAYQGAETHSVHMIMLNALHGGLGPGL